MGGLWRFLKQKISKRHPDPKPRNLESEPEPSRPVEQKKGHVEDEHLALEPASSANKPSELEKKALLEDLLVEYEDAEDDSPQEIEVVTQIHFEPTDEIEPRIFHMPPAVSNHETEAVPYSLHLPVPGTISAPLPDDMVGVSNLEAGTDSAKRSYLSIMPTTIQCVTGNTTLFVWHANFHPAIGRRFSSVLVSCKFSSAPRTSRAMTPPFAASGVDIKAFAPRKSYGATSKEQKKITWGLELPLTIPAGPVSVGVTPSGSSEVSKEVQHAFTITGSARGSPQRNNCVWTVAENTSTERGVPSELQLAALVKHSGPIQFDIDIEGRTAGGYLPSHHLRPKTDAMGKRKVIDPKKYAGLLHEFDFGEKAEAGCLNLLEKWTGRVSGALLEFDQDVVMA